MDKGRFLRHSTFLMISKLVNYGAFFFTGVIITRSLTKTEYGTFSQVVLLAMTLSLVLGVWLSKSIYYFVPGSPEKGRIVMQTSLVLLALATLFGLAIWFFRRHMAAWLGNPDLSDLSIYIGLYMILLTLWQLSESFFISTDKAHIYALANVVFSLIYVVSLSLALIQGVSLRQLLLLMVLLYVGLDLFFWASVIRLPGIFQRLFDPEMLSRQFRYSAPLFLSSFTVVLGRQLDKFIIAALYPTADFAVYFRGALELPVIAVVTYSISNMLLPQFVQLYQAGRKKDFLYLWHQAIKKTALLIFPIFVFFLFVSGPFITFLYTERYAQSASIFRLYLVILILQVTAYDCVVQATGRTKAIFIASALNVVSNLMVSLALVRLVGIVGAAIGLVVGQIVATAYYLSCIRRMFDISLAQVFPWRHLAQILSLALCLGALTYGLHLLGWVTSKLAFLTIYGAVFSGLYIALVFAFRFLRGEDISFLRLPLRWPAR